MEDFKGKLVVITGSTSGIGLASAKLFIQRGATVVLNGRRQDRLDLAVAQCREIAASPTQVVGVLANMESEREVKDMAQFVLEKFKAVHVLVNNAGRMLEGDGRYSRRESILSALDINYTISVRTPYILTHQLLPSLKEHQGSVVNISGLSGSKAIFPFVSAYATMKAAMVRMTKYMALDFAPKGVRVNCVSFGPVHTSYLKESLGSELAESVWDQLAKAIPLPGGCANAEDAANLIVFLCSDAARRITGEDIVLDGGLNLMNNRPKL